MKTVSKLIILAGLLAAPFALMAKSLETAYVESFRGRTDLPVPIKVVSPHVGSDYAGTSVSLEFIVDESGTPVGITVPTATPADLAKTLTTAVEKWKFTPLVRDGKAVRTKVVLPMLITDELDSAPKLAAK
ncbi:MAG TPA: energy transducer TonB [Candidatus Didemnitutus sp.]|nr:energy transducer TonB [Candidatus Didemnitutus sp.]